MRTVSKVLAVACWLLTAAPLWLPGQEPNLVNCHPHTFSVAAGLDSEFRRLAGQQTEAAWIGYAFPCLQGRHRIGGTYSQEDQYVPASFRRLHCRLEGRDQGTNFQLNSDNEEIPVSDHVLVFFRVANRQVERIRIFSEDCELDAGGLPVFWFTDVSPSESVALLAAFGAQTAGTIESARRISETAVAAVALHSDPAAGQALERLVDSQQPESLRRNTASWLGNLRGQTGCGLLERMLKRDPSDKVREHCIFALHASKAPEALNGIIEAARKDGSSRVREKALFWLSQMAGKKAAEALANAVEDDPETEIKKKAVFALSQLPRDDGIPRLIRVARTNRNKEVLKEAMFWLGQSKDARAVAFFEQILTK